MPAPAGSTVVTDHGLALTILSVTLDATDEVLDYHSLNDRLKKGYRYAMARLRVQNVNVNDDANRSRDLKGGDFVLVGWSAVVNDSSSTRSSVIRREPSPSSRIPDRLDVELFPGGIGEGNVMFIIPESETDLVLRYDRSRWLAFANPDSVEAPRVVDVSLEASPGQAPGHFRTNPIPPGTTVVTDYGQALTILSVTPDATDEVLNYNSRNDPPKEGYRYAMARLRVQNVGENVNASMSVGYNHFGLVGASAVNYSSGGCGVIPDPFPHSFLGGEDRLFPGGIYEGNVCFNIPDSETDLVLRYGRGWLTFANPDSVEAPRNVDVSLEPSPGQAPGHFRTNPVPIGTSVKTHDRFELTVVSVNPNAVDSNPREGRRLLKARVRAKNVGTYIYGMWDRQGYFSFVGSSAVKYGYAVNRYAAVCEFSFNLRPGEFVEFDVCFRIPETETDLTLIYVGFTQTSWEERRWLSLQ